MNETLQQEIVKLRARCEFLEAELAHLREIPDFKIIALKNKWGFTNTEAKILIALASGRVCSTWWLGETCGAGRVMSYSWTNVYIYKIRRRIAPFKITNHFSLGYQLEGESLAAVRAVIGGVQ